MHLNAEIVRYQVILYLASYLDSSDFHDSRLPYSNEAVKGLVAASFVVQGELCRKR